MSKRCRCGNEIKNAGGIDWLKDEIPMLCRQCCGKTDDGHNNPYGGRGHQGIGMPTGCKESYGRKATIAKVGER